MADGPPTHPPVALDRVQTALASLPGDRWVRTRQTVVLADSQVEPDLTAVRANPEGYLTHYPADKPE